MQRFTSILVLICLAALVLLSIQVGSLKKELESRAVPPANTSVATGDGEEHHDQEEVEVAHNMARMHMHYQKLWAALERNNAPLAGFYAHEIEEEMEVIEEAGIVDDGHDISGNMRVYGLPPVKAIQKALNGSGEDPKAIFDALRTNCNACHASSGYGFIRVAVPTAMPPAQDFDPVVGM